MNCRYLGFILMGTTADSPGPSTVGTLGVIGIHGVYFGKPRNEANDR